MHGLTYIWRDILAGFREIDCVQNVSKRQHVLVPFAG
jgi:hypothetical protein